MLVISRKFGEQIKISDTITITVVDIKERQVRLGIESPRCVPIWRAELCPGVERVQTVFGEFPVGGEG